MWDFSDPVVFFAVFTVAFGVSMLVFIYFWVRWKMRVDAGTVERGRDNEVMSRATANIAITK